MQYSQNAEKAEREVRQRMTSLVWQRRTSHSQDDETGIELRPIIDRTNYIFDQTRWSKVDCVIMTYYQGLTSGHCHYSMTNNPNFYLSSTTGYNLSYSGEYSSTSRNVPSSTTGYNLPYDGEYPSTSRNMFSSTSGSNQPSTSGINQPAETRFLDISRELLPPLPRGSIDEENTKESPKVFNLFKNYL